MLQAAPRKNLADLSLSEQGQLALLGAAERQLAECTEFEEILELRDEAEAIRAYLKARHMSHHAQNQAARLKLVAERRMGAALTALGLRGGDRKSKSPRESLILKDLGIDRNASSRWQKAAAANTEVFESYCQLMDTGGGDISTRGFLKYLRDAAHEGSHETSSARRRRRKKRPVVDTQTVTQPVMEGSKNADERLELCEELENHLATLTKLVAGVVERCGNQIERVEQREIPRYLRRMVALVAELKGAK